jgi:hypothetical protein
MPLNKAKCVKRLAEIEVENTLYFLAVNSDKHREALNELSSDPNDSEMADIAADIAFHSDEILRLAEQSAVLALYQVVELNTMKIAGWHWSSEEIKQMKLFRFDCLKSKLKSELHIELEKLAGYTAVDELRSVNNAIKHQGVVTKDLSKYSGWIVDAPLTNLDAFIKRVAPNVPTYLEALATGFA